MKTTTIDLTADVIDFNKYLLPDESGEKVRPASDWARELQESFGGIGSQWHGCEMPWPKMHGLFAFRRGEVTLWQGINGHGKSLVTSQAILSLLRQDECVCIASFEMKPVRTLKRMAIQAATTSYPEPEFLAGFSQWTDGKLWLYDQQGTVQPERIIAVARYCSDKLGITHFVIDSLMKCVRGEDDYNGQKDFVDQLCSVARDTGMHIHLVHHSRKQTNEESPPGKFDAKGSGAITDQVDNVLSVWRNKKKEAAKDQGKQVEDTEPDALVICDKQRNGEWEGRIKLWYHKPSMNYMGDRNYPPLPLNLGEANG